MVVVVMQIASITSQSGLLIWVVGLICGCFIVNAIGAVRSVKKIRLKVHNRMFVEEGSMPREPWKLINEGKRRARLITIEWRGQTLYSAAEVPAGEAVALPPRDVFKRRGVFKLRDAQVTSLYPFGLTKARRATDCDAEVLVFPKLYDAPVPAVRGLDQMPGGKHAGPGRIAAGEKFAGVRPMQSGDSYKQIHWKSSAKGTGLMVKSFEEELAGRAALLVCCEKSSPHVEACIRAAGSMALAGIEAGHQIEFLNVNEERRVRVQPFGDTSRLLEELARFYPAAGAVTPEKMAEALGQIAKRSAIHFVATSVTSLLEAEINRLQNAQKLVTLHLPNGTWTSVDCAIEYYPTE